MNFESDWRKDVSLSKNDRHHLETLFESLYVPQVVTLEDAEDAILRRLEGVEGVSIGIVPTLIRVIELGVTEKDLDYINGPTFKLHCEALAIDHEDMIAGITKRISKQVKTKKESRTKLSTAAVRDIRSKGAKGVSAYAMSKEYNVSRSYISSILRGVSRRKS